jgi:hypothetical protein
MSSVMKLPTIKDSLKGKPVSPKAILADTRSVLSPAPPKMPRAPAAPPGIDTAADRLAQQDYALRLGAGGRQSDVLTGGQGVTDEYESVKKRLLGA